MNKAVKWSDPFSHWGYFIIFVCGQTVAVLLLSAHAIWSAFRLDFIAALKAVALIQFIYLLSVGLFFVFRLKGRALLCPK